MKLGDSLGRSRRRRRKASADGSDGTPDDSTAPGETSGPGSGDAAAGPFEPRRASGLSGRTAFPWLTGRNLLIGTAAVLFGGWAVGYLLATQLLFPAPPPPGDLFEVPDLRGMGLASAQERLAGAGLELGPSDSITHPSVAAGLILGQSPLPGQVSRPDNPVRVTMSLGPQMRSVPDVLQLDEARARVVLETSGFVVDVDTAEAEEPRGQVVSVSPPPDSVVPLPAEVRLVVSAGPPVVIMPLVLNLEQAEAERMLDSLGLAVGDIEEVFRFGRDQGIVVEQEPAADTELERGSAVRLKVGRRGSGREQ